MARAQIEKRTNWYVAQATVHLGPHHPIGSLFEVIINKYNSMTLACLIIYGEGTGFTNWTCLEITPVGMRASAGESTDNNESAMEGLLARLEECAGRDGYK